MFVQNSLDKRDVGVIGDACIELFDGCVSVGYFALVKFCEGFSNVVLVYKKATCVRTGYGLY